MSLFPFQFPLVVQKLLPFQTHGNPIPAGIPILMHTSTQKQLKDDCLSIEDRPWLRQQLAQTRVFLSHYVHYYTLGLLPFIRIEHRTTCILPVSHLYLTCILAVQGKQHWTALSVSPCLIKVFCCTGHILCNFCLAQLVAVTWLNSPTHSHSPSPSPGVSHDDTAYSLHIIWTACDILFLIT